MCDFLTCTRGSKQAHTLRVDGGMKKRFKLVKHFDINSLYSKKNNLATPRMDQMSHLNCGSLILAKRFTFHLLVMPKQIFTHSFFDKMQPSFSAQK